jgi:hypothetical protein
VPYFRASYMTFLASTVLTQKTEIFASVQYFAVPFSDLSSSLVPTPVKMMDAPVAVDTHGTSRFTRDEKTTLGDKSVQVPFPQTLEDGGGPVSVRKQVRVLVVTR